LARYLAEFQFRHNTHRMTDIERLRTLMGQLHGSGSPTGRPFKPDVPALIVVEWRAADGMHGSQTAIGNPRDLSAI
jgi:hypothetical protein